MGGGGAALGAIRWFVGEERVDLFITKTKDHPEVLVPLVSGTIQALFLIGGFALWLFCFDGLEWLEKNFFDDDSEKMDGEEKVQLLTQQRMQQLLQRQRYQGSPRAQDVEATGTPMLLGDSPPNAVEAYSVHNDALVSLDAVPDSLDVLASVTATAPSAYTRQTHNRDVRHVEHDRPHEDVTKKVS